MAKLRLNKEMRETLTAFANANVRSPTFDADAEKAYQKALPLVLSAIRKKYPEQEMAILAKYQLARPDSCLVGYGENGQQLAFTCKAGDGPLVPQGYCSSRNYAWPAKCAAAIEDYNFASEQAKEERIRILRDYHALIANYQTVDDLIEVWPAAASVLQGFLNAANRNLPATLPVEAIERIKTLNVGAELLAA